MSMHTKRNTSSKTRAAAESALPGIPSSSKTPRFADMWNLLADELMSVSPSPARKYPLPELTAWSALLTGDYDHI
jgi:hypothetical protein